MSTSNVMKATDRLETMAVELRTFAGGRAVELVERFELAADQRRTLGALKPGHNEDESRYFRWRPTYFEGVDPLRISSEIVVISTERFGAMIQVRSRSDRLFHITVGAVPLVGRQAQDAAAYPVDFRLTPEAVVQIVARSSHNPRGVQITLRPGLTVATKVKTLPLEPVANRSTERLRQDWWLVALAKRRAWVDDFRRAVAIVSITMADEGANPDFRPALEQAGMSGKRVSYMLREMHASLYLSASTTPDKARARQQLLDDLGIGELFRRSSGGEAVGMREYRISSSPRELYPLINALLQAQVIVPGDFEEFAPGVESRF
ncbi:hypothetical protein [Herbiconiux sp. VKM Ac-2851]|uniref:hypothetical protein n=1 Tax=Herbiconiux sp. VKM Ac-2851 TaxID=2739025 RepID=UPI0015636FE6|nr:hypothetical protein [Herbiconiux sp. VKM Ac-2851]NQX34715.1 hypothetical protein [Herbiconiux sp. VKM Ac-2851]